MFWYLYILAQSRENGPGAVPILSRPRMTGIASANSAAHGKTVWTGGSRHSRKTSDNGDDTMTTALSTSFDPDNDSAHRQRLSRFPTSRQHFRHPNNARVESCQQLTVRLSLESPIAFWYDGWSSLTGELKEDRLVHVWNLAGQLLMMLLHDGVNGIKIRVQ